MSDTAIAKDNGEPFWMRVRMALGAMRPVRQQRERVPAYGQAAIARTLGMRQRLGAMIEEELALAWSRSAQRKVSLSLLVIEIDRMKEYFSVYGKPATDDATNVVLSAVRQALPRPEDKCLRLGRSSFVVVMPDYPALMARAAAQKISLAIRDEAIAHKESHAGIVTASIGIAVTNPQGEFDRKFFEAAAEALARGQRRGLNRIETVDLRPAQEQKRKAA
jgi:diguanylate cyclase (GGDEF)-like protein